MKPQFYHQHYNKLIFLLEKLRTGPAIVNFMAKHFGIKKPSAIPKLKTIPAGYRYKHKVYYARCLLDTLHKLGAVRSKTHNRATRAVIMNSSLYMVDILDKVEAANKKI